MLNAYLLIYKILLISGKKKKIFLNKNAGIKFNLKKLNYL